MPETASLEAEIVAVRWRTDDGGFAVLVARAGDGDEHVLTGPIAHLHEGDSVEVELTLVKTDAKDLSCGSTEEIAGKHCAFEGQNKPWSKGPSTDEKTVFKPYTTTDRVQFVAAGLWSDPNLAAASLPPNRFSVKCKYKVEGNLKKVDVRWAPDGQWFPNTDWYAGTIESCGKPVPQQ